MKWLLLLSLVVLSQCQVTKVSLKKGKSLRQNLKEHGLLENFLKKHPCNLASNYFPSLANEDASEPQTNYMDMSMLSSTLEPFPSASQPRISLSSSTPAPPTSGCPLCTAPAQPEKTTIASTHQTPPPMRPPARTSPSSMEPESWATTPS
ncbi:unnamed protein product, partial [Lepidochelys kempii]